jgi:riboflavin biosynthesis pyrimidine reductase
MGVMRALFPDALPDVDLHRWYGAQWLETGGVRMNFVSSVDGGATAAGLSEGLQTPGDNAVFAALRDLADVVIVGGRTTVDEGYRPIRLSPERAQRRAALGLPATLPTAVVSASLRLDPTVPLFGDSPAGARTIVLTTTSADPSVRAALARTCEVVDCGEQTVDLPAARAALVEGGHRRILGEGGPTLFASMAAAGVVDELCLSITPLLVGPGSRRITAGEPWSARSGLELRGLLEEDGALFARYRVAQHQHQ